MTEKPPTAMSMEELGRRLKEARRDLVRTLALTDGELSTLERHQAGPWAEDAATATVGAPPTAVTVSVLAKTQETAPR